MGYITSISNLISTESRQIVIPSKAILEAEDLDFEEEKPEIW